MALSAAQRRINATTGVNRRYVNKRRAKIAFNTFRRRSNGGMGG